MFLICLSFFTYIYFHLPISISITQPSLSPYLSILSVSLSVCLSVTAYEIWSTFLLFITASVSLHRLVCLSSIPCASHRKLLKRAVNNVRVGMMIKFFCLCFHFYSFVTLMFSLSSQHFFFFHGRYHLVSFSLLNYALLLFPLFSLTFFLLYSSTFFSIFILLFLPTLSFTLQYFFLHLSFFRPVSLMLFFLPSPMLPFEG